jgi:hypothetical protein
MGLGTRLLSATLTLTSACASPVRPIQADAAIADSSTDAYFEPLMLEPISVTGSTPAISLDAFHWIHARYASHWCTYAYEIELTQTRAVDNSTSDPWLKISFSFPHDVATSQSGTFPASASVVSWPDTLASTTAVIFDATRVDPPNSSGARIAGRAHVSSPGWSFDFQLDLPVLFLYSCP